LGVNRALTLDRHDSERAALIYQHRARGADKIITDSIDAHVEAERRRRDDHRGDRGGGDRVWRFAPLRARSPA
jgi:hypothetical protein